MTKKRMVGEDHIERLINRGHKEEEEVGASGEERKRGLEKEHIWNEDWTSDEEIDG